MGGLLATCTAAAGPRRRCLILDRVGMYERAHLRWHCLVRRYRRELSVAELVDTVQTDEWIVVVADHCDDEHVSVRLADGEHRVLPLANPRITWILDGFSGRLRAPLSPDGAHIVSCLPTFHRHLNMVMENPDLPIETLRDLDRTVAHRMPPEAVPVVRRRRTPSPPMIRVTYVDLDSDDEDGASLAGFVSAPGSPDPDL